MKESPQAVAAAEALKEEFAPVAANIKERAAQAGQDLKNKLGDLGAPARRQALAKLSAQVKGLWQKFQAQYRQRKRQEHGKVYARLHEALTEVASRGEFDLLLTGGVAFAVDDVDVTDEVLEVLREKSEVEATGST